MAEEMRIEWDMLFPSLTTRLSDYCTQCDNRMALLESVLREANAKPPLLDDAIPKDIDPFSFISCLVSLPDDAARRAAFDALIPALGMPAWHFDDYGGLQPLEETPYLFSKGEREAKLVALLSELFKKACDLADGGYLNGPARGVGREDLADTIQSIIGWGGPRASLPRVTQALSWIRPHAFLSLHAPMLDLLMSDEGLGIPSADIPVSAQEYLGLAQFLENEMEAANLPYLDFAQMERAAAASLTLAEGLTAKDRRLLVRERMQPYFRRLFPGDEERVEQECMRLIDR